MSPVIRTPMKKPSASILPPGLTVNDMPGSDAELQRINHCLYRRGMLKPVSVKALRKKLGLDGGP